MGFLKKLIKKINSRFFYVVDLNTFRNHLEESLQFALEENLEACQELDLYVHGEKHHVLLWNHTASKEKEEKEKGIILYYDDMEFPTIDDFIRQKCSDLPSYFKIELNWGDDVNLNAYREQHPELKIEDY